MANPNIVATDILTGTTDVQEITTTPTAITLNPVSSGRLYKINSLLIANYDAADKHVTVDIFRSGTAFHIAHLVTVPTTSTLALITKDSAIYLEEGDSLRCSGESDNTLHAICGYEIISE